VTVGVTRRGHRVRVNRRAMAAERRVLIGAASYHYHAGFGGGRKLLVPGLAGRETIAYNHSLTLDPRADRVHPQAAPGVLDGNPVAEEMLEGARLCRPDLLVNTVLDAGGRTVGLFCGELEAAHHAACRLVERVSRVDLSEAADLVIAAAPAAPDWVQAHKALFNAHRAVKPETGRVVLLAPCPEGLGNARFRYWLKQPDLPTLFAALRQTPEVNGQTALSTRIRGRQAIVVTQMSAADCTDLGLRTAPDLDAALRLALADLPESPRPTCYLMPQASLFLPCVAGVDGR
jgi:nickel-dependent lactate racemase